MGVDSSTVESRAKNENNLVSPKGKRGKYMYAAHKQLGGIGSTAQGGAPLNKDRNKKKGREKRARDIGESGTQAGNGWLSREISSSGSGSDVDGVVGDGKDRRAKCNSQ